jgi:hypothetical protein
MRQRAEAIMEKATFDGLTRHFGGSLTRRGALRGLFAGTLAVAAGRAVLEETAAKQRHKKRGKKGKKNNGNQATPAVSPNGNQGTPSMPQNGNPGSPLAPQNGDQGMPPAPPICAGKNWCVDRTQTCGPANGYGKCLIDPAGENFCAEILFQVATCADCEAPNCVNCRCALAAGGGDRCNNGANGYDYICVREV